MKFRSGFVTNSSSSSYVCEICGASEGGYDYCLSDAGMFECEHGHTFCTDHVQYDEHVLHYIINSPKYNENDKLKAMTALSVNDSDELKKIIVELLDFDEEEDYYEIPAALCPICNMTYIPESDMIDYLKEKFKFDITDIENEIRKKYNNIRN